MQQFYERRIHELVVVWNIQANNALSTQVRHVLLGKFGLVLAFHNKNEFCPFDEVRRQWIVGAVVQACRCALDPRVLSKYLLCRWATPPVHAANEEDALHRTKRCSVEFQRQS